MGITDPTESQNGINDRPGPSLLLRNVTASSINVRLLLTFGQDLKGWTVFDSYLGRSFGVVAKLETCWLFVGLPWDILWSPIENVNAPAVKRVTIQCSPD